MSTTAKDGKLTVDIKTGETMKFSTGGVDSLEISLTLLHKHGQVARVLVQAPEAVKIRRPARVG